MQRITRLPLILALFTLLCTCGRAPEPGTLRAVGNVRYLASSNLLVTTLNLSPPDTTAYAPLPSMLGKPLQPLAGAGAGTYRGRRTMHFPPRIELGIPTRTGAAHELNYAFSAPFPDSIPPTLRRSATTAFPVGRSGLREQESLVVFFEPTDRSAPKRIQLLGPTDTGTLTLPRKAMEDVPAGNYEVYLIKQQLHKDSTAALNVSLQTEYFTRPVPVRVVE